MSLRLIVHADDFGQSCAINEGVALAHRHGILTSASIMTPGRAFEHAVDLWRDMPSLDLGIHLTLLEEEPVSPAETVSTLLGRDGRFVNHHIGFTRRYLFGKVDQADVRRELSAQIVRALDRGLPITHLDSHQHLHMLPKIRAVVVELARRFNISAIRVPLERIRPYMLGRVDRIGRLGQMIALNGVCALSRKENVHTTDEFVGFFYGGRLTIRSLRVLLAHLPQSGTCELMCHPGVEAGDADAAGDGYLRSSELRALRDPGIAEDIRSAGIRLISFRDL